MSRVPIRLGYTALSAALWLNAATADERWYRLALDGQPAGHLHEISTREASGTRTETEMVLGLDRDGQRLDLRVQSLDLEDDTSLRQAQLNASMAGDHTQVTVDVEGDHLRVTTTTSAGRYIRQVPISAPPAGPEAIRRETLARLHHSGDQFRYTDIQEDTGDPVQVTRTLIDERSGSRAFRIEDRLEYEHRHISAQLDAEGYLIESIEDSPLGRLVTRRSDESIGESPPVGAHIPVAVSLTLIAPLPNPRQLQHWVLNLTPLDEPLTPADFTGPGQSASISPTNVITLRIAVPGTDAASRIPPMQADRDPNALFPSDAPDIQRWAHDITSTSDSDQVRIRAIVSAVHLRLRFDAGFVVANALDVLHRGRGTCVAYATLTTALLRATGLPSRVVYGYVYADGALVGHAWTEVWTDAHWRAVDAALYGDDGMDAARIALARSDGAAGLGSGLEQLARSFGRFTVSVQTTDESPGGTGKPEGTGSH